MKTSIDKTHKKRILLTDYDGTFWCGDESLIKENIAAVIKWQNAGNLFGIVTGRAPALFYPEFKNYAIPLDCLITANGAAGFDKDFNCLFKKTMPKNATIAAMEFLTNTTAAHMIILSVDHSPKLNFKQIFSDTSWFVDDTTFSDYTAMTDNHLDNILQISTAFDDEISASKFADDFNEKFNNGVTALPNKWCVDIVASGIDKKIGIESYINVTNQDLEIYTAGDGQNDVPMLKAFNGYAMHDATIEAKAATKNTCKTIVELINNLLKQ